MHTIIWFWNAVGTTEILFFALKYYQTAYNASILPPKNAHNASVLKYCQEYSIAFYLKHCKNSQNAYAILHGTGYWLLPMCEKIHSLLNIAPIIKNKVTFFGQDICPHDKSLLGTKKLIYITYLGPFMANFAHFSPIFESHWNKRPTCQLNYFYYIVPYVLYIYIVWNICFVNRKK